MAVGNPLKLAPIELKTKIINAIVETPKGCRNKFRYEPDLGLFSLGKVLPAGAVFPYDFGFIPGTKGDDGDPLDILLLMDTPAFSGCRVQIRLIGIIEAEQTEEGETMRNDRLVGVAIEAHDYAQLKSLKDMEKNLLDELEHFFVSYNEARGREFRLLRHGGPKRALKALKAGIRAAKEGR